jgi:DNA sulfur modification protein DndD
MRRLLTKGWLAPAAGKLNDALQRVVAKNDAAAAQAKAIQAARDRVQVLQKQIEGGICPTCHQELPPPHESTRQELADAEADLQRLDDDAGNRADLRLERRIGELIDTTTAAAYKERQARLNKQVATQFERTRRLKALKDRLKANSAVLIRQLGGNQDRLEDVIDQHGKSLRDFKRKQDEINKHQDKLAGILRRMGGAQPALAAEAFFFEYVRTLLTRAIERYQERTRADVGKVASEMFVKLVRDRKAYQGLRIGHLPGRPRWSGGRSHENQRGRQTAFSLIGALKRAAVRGGPVVLDSPLARLDLEARSDAFAWQRSRVLRTSSATSVSGRDSAHNPSQIGAAATRHRPGHPRRCGQPSRRLREPLRMGTVHSLPSAAAARPPEGRARDVARSWPESSPVRRFPVARVPRPEPGNRSSDVPYQHVAART